MIKRLLLWATTLTIILTVLVPSFVYAQGGGINKSANIELTWDDAPAPAPVRHDGDIRGRLDEDLVANVHRTSDIYEAGDQRFFILGDSGHNSVLFILHYVSDYAYFWFEANANINIDAVQSAADRYDNEIWRLMNYIYGDNIPPGIDGDLRIHLIHVTDYFPSLAGFFSPDDQCPNALCNDSNEVDALYLMLDYGPVNSKLYLATLSHEYQHLVQFHKDGNEYRWVDEGISQLIEHLNGFTDDPINNDNVRSFLQNPNHQLNAWSIDFGQQAAYYGAGYLFTVYLYERFGLEFIQALVQNKLDGLAGVNNVVQTRGLDTTLNQLVTDWHIANYIDNPYVADGRYYYSTYTLPSLIQPQALELRNGQFAYHSSLNQYGVDYLSLSDAGQYHLNFEGAVDTQLVPVASTSGDAMWWSYNATASATSLTRTVDLTAHDKATLKYKIWWETGNFPGFLHVLVSDDNGRHWEPQEGKLTVKRSAYEDAPGQHYAGKSNRWMNDSVDLSAYVGKQVQIRFEYITNNAVTGPGFLIDDIEIPELGWLDDVESGEGDWVADGFLRTGQMVHQDWSVTLVTNETQPQVITLPVVDGKIDTDITVPAEGGVLIISAQAPFTAQQGTYNLQMQRQ